MITRDEASALVRQLQECFNRRRFGEAAGLHTPAFYSHPLGTTGFAAGQAAWQLLTTRFPGIRVVAQDILVDGDKAAVRSAVEGIGTGGPGGPPMLFEIFRFDGGRFAEMWGASSGFPAAASPGEVLG